MYPKSIWYRFSLNFKFHIVAGPAIDNLGNDVPGFVVAYSKPQGYVDITYHPVWDLALREANYRASLFGISQQGSCCIS